MDWIKQIKKYVPTNIQEERDKILILKYIERYQDILTRENELLHMTSSAFVVNESFDKVLMAYHNIYDSWAWLGGHCDGNENLLEVALKEVKEESGLEEIIPVENGIFSIEMLPVLGHVKKGNYISSHIHISTTFLIQGKEGSPIRPKKDENKAVKWIEINDIESYCSEMHMMPIYKKIREKINKHYK